MSSPEVSGRSGAHSTRDARDDPNNNICEQNPTGHADRGLSERAVEKPGVFSDGKLAGSVMASGHGSHAFESYYQGRIFARTFGGELFALATEEPHELTLSEVVQYVLRVVICLKDMGLLVDTYSEPLLEHWLAEGAKPCDAAQGLIALAQSNVIARPADQSLVDLSTYVQGVRWSLEDFGVDAPDEVIDDYDEEIVDWCQKALPSRTAARRLAARELTFV